MTFALRRRLSPLSRYAAAVIGIGAAVFTVSSLAQTVVQAGGTGQNMIVINGQRVDTNAIVASGPETTEARTVESFHAISISLPVVATYTVAATPSVRVTTQANVLPVVITRVEHGTLRIYIEGAVTLHQPIRLEMTGPSLDAISMTGTGHLTATALNGRALALNVSGNAGIQAAGSIDHISVAISGTGSVDTSAIHARALDANVTGTAKMHAFASESAKVSVSGIGDIHIAGQPAQRQIDRSGLATISFE